MTQGHEALKKMLSQLIGSITASVSIPVDIMDREIH
jgi:hypothetical protein